MGATYTYKDGRTVTQQDDGSWVDEYGESVVNPYDGDFRDDEIAWHDGHAGSWNSDGSEVYGATGEISAAHGRWEDADGTDYDATVWGVNGAAYAGENEAELGVGATIVGFKAEGGEWDPNRAGESRVTGGLNVGAGAGVHLRYGTDADGDGRREYGAQVDALFFTIGYSTEESEPGSISNLDEEAVAYVEQTYDSAAEYASETYDSAAETVSETYDSAAETVSDAYKWLTSDAEAEAQ